MGKSLFDDTMEDIAPIPSAFEEQEAESNVQETQEAAEENLAIAEEAQMGQEPDAAIEDAENQFDGSSNEVPLEDKTEDYSTEENTVSKVSKKDQQSQADFERDYLSAQGNPDPMSGEPISQGYRQKVQISDVDPENDPRNIAIYLKGSHNPNGRFSNARPYEMVLAKFETPLENEIANLSLEALNQAIDLTAPLGDSSVIAEMIMADLQGWIMPLRAKNGFEREMEVTSITKSSETKKFSKQQKQDKTGFGLDSFKRQREE